MCEEIEDAKYLRCSMEKHRCAQDILETKTEMIKLKDLLKPFYNMKASSESEMYNNVEFFNQIME